jgi:hypothetical protein
VTKEERDNPLVISVQQVISTVNEDADIGWVEHTGKSIESGQTDIDKLESRMEVLGLAPIVESTKDTTAYGKASTGKRRECQLQKWVRVLEGCIVLAFEMAASWVDEELDEEFDVDIFDDFAISLRGTEDLPHLQKARDARDVDQETYLRELVRRDVLKAGTDIEAVMEAAKAEGPPPGSLGIDPETGEPLAPDEDNPFEKKKPPPFGDPKAKPEDAPPVKPKAPPTKPE